MKRKIVFLTILSMSVLSGCGNSITYPESFAKTAQEEKSEKAETVLPAKIWIGLSGSEAPFAYGNYPDLGILAADTAGTDAKILIAGADGNWKTVSREVMEASIGNPEDYHISSSVTEMLASGKLTFDMKGLNVMLLDLDPNLSNSAEEYGSCFNSLLKKNPGSALSIRTVPCSYDGDLTVSIEDNNSVRTENVSGVAERNMVVLAMGPEDAVTDYMQRFETGAAAKKLQITSGYDVFTDAEAEDSSVAFLPKDYLNDTKDGTSLSECDSSYNLSPVTVSGIEEYENLDSSVQVLEYTGDCMDEGWESRVYLSGVEDPENYNIFNVIVQECMDDGSWKEVDSSFLNVTLEAVSGDKTEYCLSFGEDEELTGDYAVTIQLSHAGADQNDSVTNVSASIMEYLKALDGQKKDTFEKLMCYDLFTASIGKNLYSLSDRVCSSENFLIINN